jgi:hypothetical protein
MTSGCLQFGSTRRTLNELGSVSVPRRLDWGMTIAYMVWKKDASLDKARRLVHDVYASFRPDKPLGNYLEIARASGEGTRGEIGRARRALVACT